MRLPLIRQARINMLCDIAQGGVGRAAQTCTPDNILYLAEVFHLLQHFVHFWDHIFAINSYWSI